MSKVPPRNPRSGSPPKATTPQRRLVRTKRPLDVVAQDNLEEEDLDDQNREEQLVEQQEKAARYMGRDKDNQAENRLWTGSTAERQEYEDKLGAAEEKDAGAQSKPEPERHKQNEPLKSKGVAPTAQTEAVERMEALKEANAKLQKATALSPAAPAARGDPTSALAFLHNAKEPGVFFKEREGGGQGGGEQQREAPQDELTQAVNEADALLKAVPGIERVRAGEDEDKNPIVVVRAMKGFTQGSLRAVPEKVQNFGTLIALPYELLPLKRESPPSC